MAETPTSDMRGKVVRGLGWVGASTVAGQIIRTAGAIFVARLLTPSEYGLAMLALVFASLVLVFSDLALGAALVQRKNITEHDRSTAFWISIGAGVLFTVLGVALSGPVASLYDEPSAAPLLAALSASFLLTALGATQQSLLLREMQFRKLETMTVIGALFGTVGAVVLAALGTGAWAIIGQQLATAAVTSALLWRASSWRPRLMFSRASARDLGTFSSYLVGHRLMYYLHQNADRFLIGKYLSTAALGAYAVAYNVILQPASRIAQPIQRVLSPAFARLQDEPAEDRRPLVARRAAGRRGHAAGARRTGDRRRRLRAGRARQASGRAAVPVIQLLAWVGDLQAIQAINVDILIARDRTSTLFRYSIAFCIAHVIAFTIGLQWGIVGVAAAFADLQHDHRAGADRAHRPLHRRLAVDLPARAVRRRPGDRWHVRGPARPAVRAGRGRGPARGPARAGHRRRRGRARPADDVARARGLGRRPQPARLARLEGHAARPGAGARRRVDELQRQLRLGRGGGEVARGEGAWRFSVAYRPKLARDHRIRSVPRSPTQRQLTFVYSSLTASRWKAAFGRV